MRGSSVFPSSKPKCAILGKSERQDAARNEPRFKVSIHQDYLSRFTVSLPSLSIESLFQDSNQTRRLSLETLSDFLDGLETLDGGEPFLLLDDALPASVRDVSVDAFFAADELKLYSLAVKIPWTESA